MPAYRHGQRWRYREWVTVRDGREIRVCGTPAINTKQAAKAAERAHSERVLDPSRAAMKREMPTFEEFAEVNLEIAATRNKPATVDSKRVLLSAHLTPFFGARKMNQVTYARIQDFVAREELLVVATADEADRGWRRLNALFRTLPAAAAQRFDRPAVRLQCIGAALRDADEDARMARELSRRWCVA